MLFYKVLFALAIVALLHKCRGDIVQELTKRFNDKRMECIDQHNKKHPAYECSGVLFRGVRDVDIHKKLKYAWSLKPYNLAKTSFSMTFLRKDVPFSIFPSGYNTGFIVYPHLKTPRQKRSNRVFCAFPLDGHTDGRRGKHACGQSHDDPVGTSRHCDAQGITSFNKWKSHYRKIRKSKAYFVRRQCAFDMTKERTAARDFATVIKANNFIRTDKDAQRAKYSYRVNELLLEEWNENDPNEIPIEAFFYFIGVHGAQAKARMYQDDYYRLSRGEIIPIVGIRLPTKSKPDIQIKYIESKPNKSQKTDESDQRREKVKEKSEEEIEEPKKEKHESREREDKVKEIPKLKEHINHLLKIVKSMETLI